MAEEIEFSASQHLASLKKQICDLYLSDNFPWIVGYSGGKDSTAVLQLVWSALLELPSAQRNHKKIHVISTDTLVENPIVAKWVELSLDQITRSARDQDLPISAHRLVPTVENRFWVNLIGKGYPAPRPMFRWCTTRLKISASTNFIRDVVKGNGEAILLLGTRKAESASRRKVMETYEGSTRELLDRNSDKKLDRVWTYTPISDWTSDDVWEFLIENENPWGYSNADLFNLYRGATQDSECPLVVDTKAPSCGDSRFGCFVCTMVDKDKSMAAMIQNDSDKQWMIPLAEFRDRKLRTKDDDEVRDFRKMSGVLQLQEYEDETYGLVHGPYKQHYREELLLELLKAQERVRREGPESFRDFELISGEELEEIRRIWVQEKHEIEDSLPAVFTEATGKPYPFADGDDNQPFSLEDIDLLREVCSHMEDPDAIRFQLLREMLHVEQGYRNANRRVGIYDHLEKALKKHAFVNEDEAFRFATDKAKELKTVREGKRVINIHLLDGVVEEDFETPESAEK